MNELTNSIDGLPSVYDYLDVRTYLSNYREARKKIDHGFTHTYICYSLGQKNSKGYFTNVVNGRVKIGATILERFVNLLELNSDEASYFRSLVPYSQCGEPEERETLLRELIIKNKKNCISLTEKSLPYYQHWRYAVIRAMLDIIDFDGNNLQLLLNKVLLKMSKKELSKAVELLKDLALIELNEEGFYKPSNSSITPSSSIQKELLLQNQIMQFGHSQKMMLNRDARPQKVTTMTLSVSDETYNLMKERIDALKEEIRSLAHYDQGPSERLYQLNIHLFPQSR